MLDALARAPQKIRPAIFRPLVCEPTSDVADPLKDGPPDDQAQPHTETDEALLQKLQAKEPEALAQLWDRYSGLLFTQALGVLHNPAEAEDIVIEVFAEVWRRAENYHPERARPAAWLVTLVRRRSIDKLRERRSYEKAGVRLALEIQTTKSNNHSGFEESGTDGVEEQVYLSELRRLLENALRSLPERQRETVALAYFQGLTQREIAARTCTPLGTVKTRLELGLRKMRERIRVAQLRSGAGAPNP
jgi:RNA polymerase sigma-70 factor (ECF subfamily)